MNGWQFMSDSPWLTFFLAWLMVDLLLKSWRLFMRHLNVRKVGWPRAHLDADGDWKPASKAEDTE